MGQGEGEEGDPVNSGDGEKKDKAGKDEGAKELDVEISCEELASILGEELELPRIEPKGKKTMRVDSKRYNSIGTVGPDSLRHYKRSYREALKRQLIMGTYDAKNPVVVPVKSDMRYRTAKSHMEFENAAVVIYMMDVSGSMGDEQKDIVRTESFWINLWLKSQYKDIVIRYIIHDSTAKEVDEETFFRTRESGGTLISSALNLCHEIIKSDYDPCDWNIYPFHFSDGDNWSMEDTNKCMELLDGHIIPLSNMFCYGQVESRYGSGQFYKELFNRYGNNNEKVILSKINSRDEIMDSIKDFLGKGN